MTEKTEVTTAGEKENPGANESKQTETNLEIKTEPKTETKTEKKKRKGKHKDDEEEKEDIPDYGGLSRVRKEYGRPLILWYLLGIVSSAAMGCVMPVFATLFREMINSLVYAEKRQKKALDVVYYFIIMGVSALILSVVSFAAWGYYGTKVGVAIRRDYYQILLKQEVAFHDKKNSGRLNAKLISETSDIDNAIGRKWGFLFQRLVTFIVGFVLAFIYSWAMSLVLIACVPALVLTGVIQGMLWKGAGGQNADPFVDAGSFSYEVLLNVRTVVAYPSLLIGKLDEYKDMLADTGPSFWEWD
ncbi:hypothetical protein RFI_10251 [Reticulomyxa filosa]|uniref:ABC transmembrane type-1 domain-containing protein n=1 Tax=Reticulomyxa filosa TaxID=46433 RepID=X6NNE8_RETFI|nr:hypothetical protein RFI_10251 [Reticulomyxa filosa]|eukprot:ETO26882.1 hypothetical protein RFI_10251 [Reticulomyxa filosa]